MVISIFISSTLLRQGVCVYHLNRCKTSYYCRGVWHSCPTTRNEACVHEWEGKRGRFPVPAAIFYVQSRPWAHLSRSWGGPIFYRCWFILSLSPVMIYYIFILSFNSWCFCTSDAFHSKSRNDSSDQVCVGKRCVTVCIKASTCEKKGCLQAAVCKASVSKSVSA